MKTNRISQLILCLFLITLSCKKRSIDQISNTKNYVFDFHQEKNISDEVSNYFGKQEFQLENYMTSISREQYISDSIAVKNEYSSKENKIDKNNILEVNYGKVRFVNNHNANSDVFSKYYYSGFSNYLNSHIIQISLYENDIYMLLKNDKYDYQFLQNEPIISLNKNFLLTYKNNENLNSTLSIYNIHDKNLIFNKTIWSEQNLIENAFWNPKNSITIKLRSLNNNIITYYILKY